MYTHKQNQTFNGAQKVKEEEVVLQNYTSDDEYQLTAARILLSGQKPPDSSPVVERERECLAKEGTSRAKKRPWGSKYEPKQIVSDNGRKSERCKKKREIVDNLSDHNESQSSRVMERAEEVQASLSPQFPSLIKLMLRSHVTKGFWLGLPSKFCRLHLPKHDVTIVLEDESGKEYETNFLADKTGLSGGWKGFSTAQKLLEGDAVVFHVVRPSKFKVYIVRANDMDVVDGALGLLQIDACAKETDFVKTSGTCEKAEEKHSRIDPPNILQENIEDNTTVCPGSVSDLSKSHRENLYSSDMEGSWLSGSTANFDNFSITFNGLTIDSKLSNHLRTKYHDLCCSQKSYLHGHLVESINCTLAVGIISETINIADAIRACKLTTSRDKLAVWDKTLKAFEQLGMEVGFLRARLRQLMIIALEVDSTWAAESKRYEEARVERDRAKEEMMSLELKLLELKQARTRLDDEMEALKENAERYKVMFQQEANAPW